MNFIERLKCLESEVDIWKQKFLVEQYRRRHLEQWAIDNFGYIAVPEEEDDTSEEPIPVGVECQQEDCQQEMDFMIPDCMLEESEDSPPIDFSMEYDNNNLGQEPDLSSSPSTLVRNYLSSLSPVDQKLVENSGDNVTDTNKNSTTSKRAKRKWWRQMTFKSSTEATTYLKGVGTYWRKRRDKKNIQQTQKCLRGAGPKEFYKCTSNSKCSAWMYLQESSKSTINLYRRGPHVHNVKGKMTVMTRKMASEQTQEENQKPPKAKRIRKKTPKAAELEAQKLQNEPTTAPVQNKTAEPEIRGLPPKIRELVNKLYESGVNTPTRIYVGLLKMNIALTNKTQLKNYLATLRRRSNNGKSPDNSQHSEDNLVESCQKESQDESYENIPDYTEEINLEMLGLIRTSEYLQNNATAVVEQSNSSSC